MEAATQKLARRGTSETDVSGLADLGDLISLETQLEAGGSRWAAGRRLRCGDPARPG